MTIADTGTGMDEETCKKIFEPFFTTKEVGKGTGLGLSSVYGIVKQHNGHIDVKSELGKGTQFDIYLPLIADANQIVDKAKTSILDKKLLESRMILIADDNRDLLETTSFHLGSEGYKVITCNNGRQALDSFKEGKNEISLVILDMVMPLMSGKECCLSMRKIKPDIPVILTSGYTIPTALDDFSGDSKIVFLQKPVSLDTLLSTVSKLSFK